MSNTSQVLAQSKDGNSKITVWSSDKACGLEVRTPKGLMCLVAEDRLVPFIDFFNNEGMGTPSALYAGDDNKLVIQIGCVDYKHHAQIIDTSDLLFKTKPNVKAE